MKVEFLDVFAKDLLGKFPVITSIHITDDKSKILISLSGASSSTSISDQRSEEHLVPWIIGNIPKNMRSRMPYRVMSYDSGSEIIFFADIAVFIGNVPTA